MQWEDFKGEWRINRQIEDFVASETSSFTGRAEFTPDGDRYAYFERGTLQTAGRLLLAERRYVWQREDEEISVLFEDGRPFHRFSLEGDAEASHFCDPDTYDVNYSFAENAWSAVWRVKGPRKDYRMESSYQR